MTDCRAPDAVPGWIPWTGGQGHGAVMRRRRRRSEPEPPGTADLVVTPTDSGLLLAGDRSAIERYVESLGSILGGRGSIRRKALDTASMASTVGALRASSGEYVKFSRSTAEQLSKLGRVPSATDGYFQGALRATDGSIRSFVEWAPVDFAPEQALALQQAATMMALRAAINEVTEAIERVEGKLDVLTDLVRSERIGRAIADFRMLSQLADRIDAGEALGDTDWSTLAHMGAEIGRDIESLRSFVKLRLVTISDVPGWRHSARADALESLIDAKLPDVLGLLVVCEQNYSLWQRCRLARVASSEPDRLDDALRHMRAELAGQSKADQELLDELTDVVAVLAEIRGLEGLNPMTARKLTSVTTELDRSLDWFAEQRTLDHDWTPARAPRLRESLRDLTARGAGVARSAPRSIAKRIRPGNDDRGLPPGVPDAAFEPDSTPDPTAESEHEAATGPETENHG